MKLFIVLGLLSTVFCLLVNDSQAQAPNLITVTPQLVRLDLSIDSPEAEYTYTNNTNQTIELGLTMQDVKELEERGVPGLIDPNQSKSYKYGLSSWASFSTNNLVILPGESKKITIFIDKNRLTLGGHYASVLAEIKQLDEQKRVKLRAILSSLLFVRLGSENEKEAASIIGFDAIQDLLKFPDSFQFRVHNSGNVDITPYGTIRVYDPFGREVSKTSVNEDSLITLPDSIRKYTVALNSQNTIKIPGLYTAKISLRYGKKNLTLTKDASFITVGSLNKFGIGAIVLLSIAILLLAKMRKKQSES